MALITDKVDFDDAVKHLVKRLVLIFQNFIDRSVNLQKDLNDVIVDL